MVSQNTKNILLLFSKGSLTLQKANPETLCKLLNKEGVKTNTCYSYAIYNELIHTISSSKAHIFDPRSGRDLEEFDLVYHRRWGDCAEIAVATGIYLSKKGVKQLDEEILRPGSMNKLTQHWRLWEYDLPLPKTHFVPNESLAEWIETNLESMHQLPCIMKSIEGTRGSDNYLVQSKQEALKIVSENPNIGFLIQEYIPNDGDYRVFVSGDQIGLVIHRTASPDSHKNNTSLGARAELFDASVLPKKVQEDCIRAARVFKRSLAGVDVVFSKTDPNSYYFFEVNRSPQIEASSYSAEKAKVIDSYFTDIIEQEG